MFIGEGEESVLMRQPDAFAVHGQEAGEEVDFREVASVTLDPQPVGAEGADDGRVAVLHKGLPGVPYTQEEPGEGLVSAAPGEEPSDLVLDLLDGLQMDNPSPVRFCGLIDEGGNHPYLAFLGPGDKRVLFVWHKPQHY